MKLKTKILISLILVVLSILITNTKVQAKSYYIDDMQIEATIQENGDLQIEQTLKYVFNGEYNGIYITIPTKYSNNEKIISDISNDIYDADGVEIQSITSIDENNNKYTYTEDLEDEEAELYTEEDMGDIYQIKIYSPVSNEKRTYKIKYVLQNVCVKHSDVGELYYNFIGGDWKCKINRLNIDIFLPNNQNDIEIWGHGPDNGYSEIIDNKHARFSVKNVGIGKYVAARVIFDKSNISNTLKKSNLNAYNIIYKDEQEISKISDAKNTYTRNIYILSLILIVYWIILLIKYEKDKKIDLISYNEDELFKKYNPMLAGCLQGSRDILARDIIGVILNLIDKNNIKLKVEKLPNQERYTYIISANKEKENSDSNE